MPNSGVVFDHKKTSVILKSCYYVRKVSFVYHVHLRLILKKAPELCTCNSSQIKICNQEDD